MKVSKLLKKLMQNHDNVTMSIKDYSYMQEYPHIYWLDLYEEGIWGLSQEEVISQVYDTILPILEEDKSRVYHFEYGDRIALCIRNGSILVEVFMDK